ncbi:MAG: molybdopterin-dependent oxidoreductase [Desulfurococcales archaeon]|nr:molybdopterin-dependent oxidoreductase [Desulfurococcales archaeon]
MPKLKRREFLKLAAVTTAIIAASKSGLEPIFLKEKDKKALLQELAEPKGLEERYFVCRICGGGCVLKGYIDRTGKLVKIEGDPQDWVSHGTPCVKGKTSLKMLYDPDRLKKPLKRTNPDRGFVIDEKGTVREMIDPKWVEISWDEALDQIADKIAEAIKTWGPQSIVFIGHGKGSALANLIGTPNVIKHHSTCHSSWDVTLKPMFGGLPNADMENSKLIISFGFDQGAGKSKNPFAWLFSAAKRNGAKIIVFEPRLSETASKATEWIPIKPGTDAAVAFAMVNVIISEGLYDKDFLLKYTNAPILVDTNNYTYVKDEDGNLLVYDEAVNDIVPLANAKSPALVWSGEYNGKSVATAFYLIQERISQYTPEWAEQVSGVPASKIREIAREFATVKPASIPHWKRSGGTGPNREQGVETYKAIALLMTLTGNIEVRGGWILNRTAKFISKAISKKPKKKFSDLYPIPDEYQGKTVDEREKFPVYNKHTKEGAYQKIWYNILNDYPYPVKVLIIWGQGLQAFMDYELIEKAIKHVVEDNNGIVVNVNIYPDEMATLADIVLPEKLFLEGGPSIGFSKSFDITYRIHWVDGIEPVYPDVKSEGWITKQLAYKIGERLGISPDTLEKEYFSEYFLLSSEEKLRKMIDAYNEKLGTNITLEELSQKKVISVPWKPKDLSSLKTPSGRIEILITELAENGYDPLPAWKDTFTYNGSLSPGELVVVSSVFAMNRHSKTVNNEWLRYFLAKHHADKVWIHPSTAEKIGVKEGDYVIIEYSRPFNPNTVVHAPTYKLLARVHVTEAVRPDVIFIPHGTGQLSQFMKSYDFGTRGGDGLIKPVIVDYKNPAASAADQDFIVRVRAYA